MNQPSDSTVWKVHFSVCFTVFLIIFLLIFFFFTNTYKWLVYRESQGRELAVFSEVNNSSSTLSHFLEAWLCDTPLLLELGREIKIP